MASEPPVRLTLAVSLSPLPLSASTFRIISEFVLLFGIETERVCHRRESAAFTHQSVGVAATFILPLLFC